MNDIVQNFYDDISDYYHLIFLDWDKSISWHASIIDKLLVEYGVNKDVSILDCACGIGTQSLGLSQLGYKVTGSDISKNEISRAIIEAKNRKLDIQFFVADFCNLAQVFREKYNVVIAIDNALPHMIENNDLVKAISSIYEQIEGNGLFIASIRDYDKLIKMKPQNSPPYIINTPTGRRIAFQLWDWENDTYDFTQYIIENENNRLDIHKFDGKYRAITRAELTEKLELQGFTDIKWIMPSEEGFYQPIVVAHK
jgi:SAM-dependent methyltransferase